MRDRAGSTEPFRPALYMNWTDSKWCQSVVSHCTFYQHLPKLKTIISVLQSSDFTKNIYATFKIINFQCNLSIFSILVLTKTFLGKELHHLGTSREKCTEKCGSLNVRKTKLSDVKIMAFFY